MLVAVDCGMPPGVPNGKQTFKTTTYNSSAVYQCLPGYRLVGKGIKTCLASGLWSPDITLCVGKTSVDVDDVLLMIVYLSSFTFYSTGKDILLPRWLKILYIGLSLSLC